MAATADLVRQILGTLAARPLGGRIRADFVPERRSLAFPSPPSLSQQPLQHPDPLGLLVDPPPRPAQRSVRHA